MTGLVYVGKLGGTGGFSGGGSSITVVPDSGVLAAAAVGDLMVAYGNGRSTGYAVSCPGGWTVVDNGASTGQSLFTRFIDASDLSSNLTYLFSVGGTAFSGAIVVVDIYRGAKVSAPIGSYSVASTAAGSSITTTSLTATLPGSKLLAFFNFYTESPGFSFPPAGMTQRGVHANGGEVWSADQAVGLTATGTRTLDHVSSGGTAAALMLQAENSAPNAPTLASPASGEVLNRNIAQRLSWTFSDPDSGDSQSARSVRIRLVGAGSWTTYAATTANGFYDIAAGGLADGDYEWQVSTTDSLGLVGPFSSSSFFTMATAPAAPTITSPTSGATIGLSTAALSWSYPTETEYQVRKVADSAGSPDTGTIYYDSGAVVDAVTRSVILAFPVNSRYEHLQVRVKDAGLWSTWSSIRVLVSYTAPATPTLAVAASNLTGSITLTPTQPTPAGSQPTVVSIDVHRRVGASGTPMRVARDLTPAAAWTDWSPANGVDYRYMIRAVGTNGTTADSAWSS